MWCNVWKIWITLCQIYKIKNKKRMSFYSWTTFVAVLCPLQYPIMKSCCLPAELSRLIIILTLPTEGWEGIVLHSVCLPYILHNHPRQAWVNMHAQSLCACGAVLRIPHYELAALPLRFFNVVRVHESVSQQLLMKLWKRSAGLTWKKENVKEALTDS